MISQLMVSSKNVKVSQKCCLGTSIESFTGSSLSEQIICNMSKLSVIGIASLKTIKYINHGGKDQGILIFVYNKSVTQMGFVPVLVIK